ncbi:hypothetical protein BSKO_06662 [Bryopsis sp. KO-2023]|nr:hypothetical protein BSKO_06662 [Bryopsis sp. KO-2023]
MSIQREWYPPALGDSRPLMLYNSLVDEKTVFVPSGGAGSKNISWYACGPTVYDSAHMGHARNYVTFDIVRRILEDYFGYNCLFIMNVTDVDDKIILRARRNFLLNKYKAATTDVQQVIADSLAAINGAIAKQEKKVAELEGQLVDAKSEGAQRKVDDLSTMLDQENLKLKQRQEALPALDVVKATNSGKPSIDNILAVTGDYVSEVLDNEKKATVTDQSIFREHAAKYEAEFMEDLATLGCREPDAFTRVSEYMDEIVEYVKGIVDGGFAYESNGSVYFDNQEFRRSGHTYGKLNPWAVGSATLAAEGEANFETSEKRHPSDFALWKASKPGEPFWDSPWGEGRPGWHIECSAMASSIIGSKMDIHTGGEDLKFPHHNNELAQAEAYFHTCGCRQWVNYFLHSGHLGIEGLKMSKSLKNFITIREALATFTPRQIRLMFVLQPWNKPMIYGEQSREEMKAKEALLKNFFQNVDVVVRDANVSKRSMRWEAEELELQKYLSECQKAVHESLSDNINTRAAMDALAELIKNANIYMSKKEAAKSQVHPFILKRVAGYVTKMLATFGLVDHPCDNPGFGGAGGAESANMAKYLDAFCGFRDEVRALARAKAEPSSILSACDKVRDETLVDAGLRLEDKANGESVWKLDDPEVMRAELAAKAKEAAEKKVKKLQGKLDRLIREKERFEKAMAPPEKYSQFDAETGNPTHSKDGALLEGKALDNAKKDMDKIRKRRAPFEKKLEQDPDYLANAEKEISEVKAEIAELG